VLLFFTIGKLLSKCALDHVHHLGLLLTLVLTILHMDACRDVFNVFLGAMLGGSVLAELPTFIQNPSQIWSALSSAIPASSNFFINYVSYRALVMAWFRLFYPHQGIMVSILKWMHILPCRLLLFYLYLGQAGHLYILHVLD